MTVSTRHFPNLESASESLADRLGSTLNEAIAERGRATIAVSGGRTPPVVFRHLLEQPVSWDRVTVTLTDERWVPPDHEASNENLVRSLLLVGPAKAATFVPMYGGEPSPDAGHSACEARLSSLGKRIDAVYLGMGADGHIASLFPRHPAVDCQNGVSVSVSGPDIDPPRMSLTPKTIVKSRHVFLLFSGAEKHDAFEKALLAKSCRDFPVRILYGRDKGPVEVLMAP